MRATSKEVRLARRPRGRPVPDDFELAEVEVPEPADGELRIRNTYMSLDPYMRPRMNDAKSYLPPFALGEPLSGGAVGQVVASRHPDWRAGSWVAHQLGWREAAVSDGTGLSAIDPDVAPVSTALGVLGMPGLTAYVGLLDIGRPVAGETVFVSGAAGAVGSIVGQLAKLRGCRVIGSAGSAEKVAWLRELGFDAAFDYREDSAREALSDGIDLYFDNVGGPTLEAALFALNRRGRVVACGSIAQYNATEPPIGPRNLHLLVTKRLRLEGFIVFDHEDRRADFLREMGEWVRDGSVRYRETIVDGIEQAPAAFAGLFEGENIGKLLVRVGPDSN